MNIPCRDSFLKRTESPDLYADSVNCFSDNVSVSGLRNTGSVLIWPASSVISLCDHINPVNVARRIRAIVVGAVYGESRRPFIDVVKVESLKRVQPSTAYCYASPSVVVERFVGAVCAAPNHRSVNGVKRMLCATRNIRVLGSFFVALCSLFVSPTTAGNNLSPTQILTGNGVWASTITDAVPHRSAAPPVGPIWAQRGKSPEPLSSDVNSQFLSSGGRHDIANLGKGMLELYHGADSPEYLNWIPAEDVYEGSLAIQFSARLRITD